MKFKKHEWVKSETNPNSYYCRKCNSKKIVISKGVYIIKRGDIIDNTQTRTNCFKPTKE